MRKPLFIIVGGPNGAGKTSVGQRVVRDWLKIKTYLNADLIAKSLGPEHGMAVEAGRQLIRTMRALLNKKVSFAVESTLSSIACRKWLKDAMAIGYKVWILYVYLESPELARARVKKRVQMGGHCVEDAVVNRRYASGLETFRTLIRKDKINYLIINNSTTTPLTVAVKTPKILQIGDYEVYTQVKSPVAQHAKAD